MQFIDTKQDALSLLRNQDFDTSRWLENYILLNDMDTFKVYLFSLLYLNHIWRKKHSHYMFGHRQHADVKTCIMFMFTILA